MGLPWLTVVSPWGFAVACRGVRHDMPSGLPRYAVALANCRGACRGSCRRACHGSRAVVCRGKCHGLPRHAMACRPWVAIACHGTAVVCHGHCRGTTTAYHLKVTQARSLRFSSSSRPPYRRHTTPPPTHTAAKPYCSQTELQPSSERSRKQHMHTQMNVSLPARPRIATWYSSGSASPMIATRTPLPTIFN